MNALIKRLRTLAANRHKKFLFGDQNLKIFTTTPAGGETVAATIADGWRAQRTDALTADGTRSVVSGAWQFEIAANADWRYTQAFMLAAVAVEVYGRRWRVKKVERPVGESLVWKLRAEIQTVEAPSD